MYFERKPEKPRNGTNGTTKKKRNGKNGNGQCVPSSLLENLDILCRWRRSSLSLIQLIVSHLLERERRDDDSRRRDDD